MKQNVLFIHMPIRENAPCNNVPLGVLLLATHLNKKGYKANILDLNTIRPFSNEIKIRSLLKKEISDFDVFCLSGLITTIKFQELIAKIIRELKPSAKIIAGGGLVTDIGKEVFKWIPELDSINIGSGELGIERIIDSNVNINYGTLPKNIDDYPFDYSLVDVDKYIRNPIWGSNAKNSSKMPFTMKRSLNSITSRGCQFNCNFCSTPQANGNKVRFRSAECLITEMKQLIKNYNIDFWGATDDNATSNKKRLIEFSKLKTFTLDWGTHARLDDIGSDKEKAKILADSGLVYIGFGGESASKRILKCMNKGSKVINSEDYKYDDYVFPKIYVDALENCKENNLHANMTWMMGYPHESLEELQTTISFILFVEDKGYVEKKYNNHSLFIATAYPNTHLFNEEIVQYKINKAFSSFKEYVYALDDATKMIENNEVLLNYSDMDDETFLEVRGLIEKDKLEEVLDL